MKVDKILVAHWDCLNCSRTGIEGFVYDCPGCGRGRPKGVKFYLPDNPREATPGEQELMGNDPNWYCEHCDTGNKDSKTNCDKCGAPKGSSPSHATQLYDENHHPIDREDTAVPDLISIPRRGNIEPGDLPVFNSGTAKLYPKQVKTQEYAGDGLGFDIKPVLAVLGGIAAVIAIVFLIYQVFFNLHTGTAKITSFNWNHTVRLEEIRTFHEGGWSVPAGGKETNHYQKQDGTKKVIDGYDSVTENYDCSYTDTEDYPCSKDNGNGGYSSGTCSRSKTVSKTCPRTVQKERSHQEPVYNTWYEYDIDRWTTVVTRNTSGVDQKPYYDPIKAGSVQRRIEDPGTYTISFHNDEVGDFSKSYSLDEFVRANPKVSYEIKINFFKMVMVHPSIK